MRTGPTPIGLLAVALGVSAACLLRFIGIVLVPVTAVSVFVACADRGLLRAVSIGAVTALAACAGAAAAALRNMVIGAPAFGSRTSSGYTVVQAVADLLSTLGTYLLGPAGSAIAVIAGLVVVALIAAGAIGLLRAGAAERNASLPVLLFIGGYGALLMAIMLSIGLEHIDARYLSPVYGPTVVLVVAGARSVLRSAGTAARRPEQAQERTGRAGAAAWSIRAALIVIAVAFVTGNAAAGVRAAVHNARVGVGYESVYVVPSPLVVAAGNVAGKLITNDPVLVYWVTGRHPIPGRAALSQNSAAVLREKVSSGAVTYYAYFRFPRTTQGTEKDDLAQAGIVLHEVADFKDGTLYALTVGAAP
jgi:hypothetical protein